jgi:hypothetical protein
VHKMPFKEQGQDEQAEGLQGKEKHGVGVKAEVEAGY